MRTDPIYSKIDVLLIEDNPDDAALIQDILTATIPAQYKLESADDLSSGLERIKAGEIDIVLLDLSLPDSQGLETFDKVQSQAPTIPIVVLTGLEDESVGVKAVYRGAQDYLVKGDVESKLLIRAMQLSEPGFRWNWNNLKRMN